MKKIFLFLLSMSLSFKASALVDYSEPGNIPRAPKKDNRIKINKGPSNFSKSSISPKRSKSSPWGILTAGVQYKSSNIELAERSGKLNSWHFDGHLQTPYGFYLNASHYLASSEELTEINPSKGSFQSGNPTIKLGFNWFRFGNGPEAGSIDLIAGMRVGKDNADFATERTDKIFGIETSKKIMSVVLGLGYEYQITGDSSDRELSIGNIQKIYGILGWMATPDIRFSFEAGTVKISPETNSYSLADKVSFGYVTPKLHLAVSPMFALELGALFRTKRLKTSKILDAKLYDLPGAYGSGIFAGLTFEI